MTHDAPFLISRLPRVEFGPGMFDRLPSILLRFGRRVLVVTGGKSFRETARWSWLVAAMQQRGIAWQELRVAGEPSPQLVDEAVQRFRGTEIEVVLGIGGGSVLDAAKAIAGLLGPGNSVMDHLEGVGPERPYAGPATPYIAVPTTAGTGSEATKNAVLSVRGKGGFKKSFRDEQLVPQYAVVDPDLLATCPPELIAANGMDAFTQLLESYVSARANPFTDALALSGLAAVRDGLVAWYDSGDGAPQGREKMAYAALLSGMTLAQAGLGSVHGLAAPLGAFFPVPHGVACGTLVAAASRANIEAMEQREPANPALEKYARAGRLVAGEPGLGDAQARTALLEALAEWVRCLRLPGLGAYGMEAADIASVVANCRGSSMKTNPIVLTDAEVGGILRERL
ncbi:MAG: iron-containing alcohol dehydrogenase [Pseudomonadota bacterium]